jgi:hypothetical protein
MRRTCNGYATTTYVAPRPARSPVSGIATILAAGFLLIVSLEIGTPIVVT